MTEGHPTSAESQGQTPSPLLPTKAQGPEASPKVGTGCDLPLHGAWMSDTPGDGPLPSVRFLMGAGILQTGWEMAWQACSGAYALPPRSVTATPIILPCHLDTGHLSSRRQ